MITNGMLAFDYGQCKSGVVSPASHCMILLEAEVQVCALYLQVQPRYLSCITTTCFYHAAKAYQGAQVMIHQYLTWIMSITDTDFAQSINLYITCRYGAPWLYLPSNLLRSFVAAHFLRSQLICR